MEFGFQNQNKIEKIFYKLFLLTEKNIFYILSRYILIYSLRWTRENGSFFMFRGKYIGLHFFKIYSILFRL